MDNFLNMSKSFISNERVITGLPTVETNPVIWKGKLCIGHIWQSHWDNNIVPKRIYNMRFTDAECKEIIGYCPWDMPFSTAFVWKDTCYIFGGMRDVADDLTAYNSYMTCSKDLNKWTEPVKILSSGEQGIYNHSICYDGKRFIMVIESDSNIPFTFHFAESEDIKNWRYIPNAVYGKDKYAGGPTLKYSDGYFYLMYLAFLRPRWWFETWMERSPNLVDWEPSPVNPILVPEPTRKIHPNCPVHPSVESQMQNTVWQSRNNTDFASMEQCPARGYECNTSDADLCEYNGKTRIYFTGGCQHWGGLLQYVDIPKKMSDFFKSCYPTKR